MANQMIAGGQGEALKAMEKSVLMGGALVAPKRLRMQFCGFSSDAASYVNRPIHLGGWRLRHALSGKEIAMAVYSKENCARSPTQMILNSS